MQLNQGRVSSDEISAATALFPTQLFLEIQCGISARHLIYATKNGQSTKNAPLKDPIMAIDVKDDTIRIMNNGKLVLTKVTGG